ncbi:hypothetical protein BGW39_004441 [Mortierella sp. 14UC]|nr:hypothetical protein BGW39_004441 [Mortierella sp. 14UC]
MKLNFLIAALAATVVSALPTSNTSVATTASVNRVCRDTVLRWSVGARSSDQNDLTYDNMFTFKVSYPDGWRSLYYESFSFRNA